MKKILIVDDQQGIRTLLNELLMKEGFETFQASNGIQAVEMLNDQPVDLMLLDMKLPRLDGLGVLTHTREELNYDFPVIMMTAYGEQQLIDQVLAYKNVQYFVKPFNIFELLQKIRETFDV